MTDAGRQDVGSCAALGMFDGVHLGHRRILAAAKNKSTELAVPTSVLLFSSSPYASSEILPLDDRLSELADAGADLAYVYDFPELRDRTPEEFVTAVLRDTVHARAVFAGFNYTFGAHAAGNSAMLERLCAENGIGCGITDRVEALGGTVSSTRIRALLAEGDVETANALLTYPYYLTAPILHGKALGRTLGFATINQAFGKRRALPASGIYYTKTTVDGKTYRSVSNVGTRPTVEQAEAVNLETHLLDFDGDLYGKIAKVAFYGRGRPERRFDSVEALTDAVLADCEKARKFFEDREG